MVTNFFGCYNCNWIVFKINFPSSGKTNESFSSGEPFRFFKKKDGPCAWSLGKRQGRTWVIVIKINTTNFHCETQEEIRLVQIWRILYTEQVLYPGVFRLNEAASLLGKGCIGPEFFTTNRILLMPQQEHMAHTFLTQAVLVYAYLPIPRPSESNQIYSQI